MSDPLSSLSGHSVDPGLAGLLGQRAPRSRQPFMVTFFRASPGPIRAPRAVRPLKRRQPKKTNELPYPNKLPGIFGEGQAGPESEASFLGRTLAGGDRALGLTVERVWWGGWAGARGACRGKQKRQWEGAAGKLRGGGPRLKDKEVQLVTGHSVVIGSP